MPAITFATPGWSTEEYKTIAKLVEDRRAHEEPVKDVFAIVRIARRDVYLEVPRGVYSKQNETKRSWRTPSYVKTSEQAWLERLGLSLISLAEKL